MNEKMHELLDKIQDTATQMGDIATDAAYGVGKKAGEMLSVAKARIQIANLESSVKSALLSVGEMLYATHTGTPTDSEILLHKLQEIDELKARISELELQLGRKQAAICPICGAVNQDGDQFCRECGGKL